MFRDYPNKIDSEELIYLILLSNKNLKALEQVKNSKKIKEDLITKGFLTANGGLKTEFEPKLKPQLQLFPSVLTDKETIVLNKLHSLVRHDRDVIKITNEQLRSLFDFGKEAINEAINGLEQKLLMFVLQERDAQGRFSFNRITLFERN